MAMQRRLLRDQIEQAIELCRRRPNASSSLRVYLPTVTHSPESGRCK